MLGFGTYKLKDPDIIKCALDIGYTLFDSAELYRNESVIADVLKTAKYQIDIVTKISFDSIRKNMIKQAFNKRLEIFTDIPIHAILLHHPYKDCRKTWDELVNLYSENTVNVKHIGVSNYNKQQLESLEGSDVVPMYNEIEINPFCNRSHDTVEYCREHDIKIIAHTPLMKGTVDKLYDVRISSIAKSLNITEAQVLIKWSLQNKYIVIPQANTPERIIENMISISVSDFDDNIMSTLDNMNEDYNLTKIPV